MAQQEIDKAKAVIHKHVIAAAAAGAVPIPGVDLALLTGAQLNMVRRLAQIYGVEFKPERGRALVVAFVGSIAPLASASVVKAIPLLGTLVGGVSWLALAGASTYAVGKVFIQHFESGGTLLTLDSEKVMDYYREQLHGYQRAQARDGDSEDYEGVEP